MSKNIDIKEKDLIKLLGLAKQRHDAKPKNIRNTGILIKESQKNIEEQYLPHFIGLIGEFAWGQHSGQFVDEKIHKKGDSEDFQGEEVKTITYFGTGEPELKIKIAEFKNKFPNKYILARVKGDQALDFLKGLTVAGLNVEVELLGLISREDFDEKKKVKKYGINNPFNYVVPLSKMIQL